jgi:phosphoribosylanthranilate isomerase
MSVPKIKFCGITRAHDAEQAVSLGVWAIGLNFWPGSPRAVSIAQAAELAALVKRRAESVGVFVNATLDEIVATVDQTAITIVQLHGDEGPSFATEVARRTGCKVIKAMRVQGGDDIQSLIRFHTDFHLLDSYTPGVPGGSGAVWNWDLMRLHNRLAPPKNKGQKVPVILSGGLTAENVGEAIAIAHPWGVDVASGIESAPGYKDHEKMTAFAAAVAATAPPPSITVDQEQETRSP